MKILRKSAIFLSAAILLASFSACNNNSKNNKSAISSSDSSLDSSADETLSDSDAQLFSGDFVTSSSGIKLYYDKSSLDQKLIDSLEKYFTAIANKDFDSFCSVIQPQFMQVYSDFLKNSKDYGYDYKTSFEKLYSGCSDTVGGDFSITRIKVALADTNDAESYISQNEKTIGGDLLNKIKQNSDSLLTVYFSVMAESGGKETVLANERTLILSCKDGKYYIVA